MKKEKNIGKPFILSFNPKGNSFISKLIEDPASFSLDLTGDETVWYEEATYISQRAMQGIIKGDRITFIDLN